MSELIFYKKILKAGKVKFTSSILEKNILLEPNSKNFLGLVSILKSYGVKCLPYQIDSAEFPIKKLPFISHKSNPDEIILIDKVENEFIFYTNNDGNYFRIKKIDLEKEWSRNIITLDFSSALEKKYLINYITENINKILYAVIIIVSVFSIFYKLIFPVSLIYLLNNLIGLYVCFKLYDINVSQNQSGSKICNLTEKSNCLSVINHKNSKLFGFISYDKIGFIYFIFALFLPVLLNNNELLPLFVIFVISSLFPLYSFYFQYFVVKSWCPLCLIIQINLIVNFILFYCCSYNFSLTSNSLLISLSILIIISTGVIKFTINSDQKDEIKYLRNRLNLFLNNSEIFENSQQKNIQLLSIPNSRSIITGNNSATNKITFVTNPFCKYCSEKYILIKEVIAYNDNIKLETIYCITNDLEIIKTITYKLIEIYVLKGADEYFTAANDWYSNGYNDYKKWLKKFSNENHVENTIIDDILNVHTEWCKLSLIDATPTILLNDKILSVEYEIEDLKYIV